MVIIAPTHIFPTTLQANESYHSCPPLDPFDPLRRLRCYASVPSVLMSPCECFIVKDGEALLSNPTCYCSNSMSHKSEGTQVALDKTKPVVSDCCGTIVKKYSNEAEAAIPSCYRGEVEEIWRWYSCEKCLKPCKAINYFPTPVQL